MHGLEFYYRRVGFGTGFKSVVGTAPGSEQNRAHPEQLYSNELVADVGSTCVFDSSDLRVLDHHFRSENLVPSASALVLQYANQIRSWGESLNVPAVWLVTHESPDFDAFCSLYLARKVLEREITPPQIPKGWDWFNPEPSLLPAEHRWPMLLGAYATAVDYCKPLRCPADRRIHAVLYAALYRGRQLGAGVLTFFDAVRDAIENRGLNPMFDLLFDERSEFAPELEFLARDRAAYGRDFARLRRANVTVLRGPRPFGEWFPEMEKTSFFEYRDFHLSLEGHSRERVEGVFFRDPESVLFKEWAREDSEHAVNGLGFVFTAVCYSRGLVNTAYGNTARYFVALDPERAEGRHLYHVWAALQDAEFQARGITSPPGEEPRQDFKGRNVGADPWYDGNAYGATIVDTPRNGTRLGSAGGPGLRSYETRTVGRCAGLGTRAVLEWVVSAPCGNRGLSLYRVRTLRVHANPWRA
jgi:hypothetical protein